MNNALKIEVDLNQIFDDFTNYLDSYALEEEENGCKTVIVSSNDISLTFSFIPKESGISKDDYIMVMYNKGDVSSKRNIYTLSAAKQIIRDFMPEKIKKETIERHM